MHGLSEYDELTMTIKWSSDGYWWVYAQKRTVPEGLIEDIPDEPPLQISADEVRYLEDHSNGNEVGK